MVKQKTKNKKVLGGFYIFFKEELVKRVEELFQELHISECLLIGKDGKTFGIL